MGTWLRVVYPRKIQQLPASLYQPRVIVTYIYICKYDLFVIFQVDLRCFDTRAASLV